MWNDTDKTLALYYDAITSADQSTPYRVTKILDSEGKLVLEYNDASFLSNPQNVLDDCKIIFGDSK
jgi:peroxiredoxin